jgi:multicomponent Na+:H+ antiporter subunit B
MIKRLFLFVLIFGLGYMFFSLLSNFQEKTELTGVGRYYAEQGADELGSANLVTSIVVTYRGFDTLGEVTILFLTALIIGFVLSVKASPEKRKFNEASEILTTASKMMIPIVIMFGVYVFINGHLTPGGGFQGGAIIASGVALLLLAQPDKKINHTLISVIEAMSGIGFVVVGLLGIILASGFLDNRIIGLGTFGHIISAGAIPIIYIFIGLKVGSELTSILLNLKETQNQE